MKRRAGRIRWILVAVAILLLLWFSALGLWLVDKRSEPDPFVNAVLSPRATTLAPRIHMLGQLFPSVAYAIETSDGLVLVDSGLEPDALSLRKQLHELGLNVTRLRAILLTHAHGDHTLGARGLQASTGAKIYAGRGDSEVIRTGGPREAVFSNYPMNAYALHATPVDVELVGGEVLKFGDTQIEAISTPGHTPGSTCYLLQRGKLRVLFTGDTVTSLVTDIGTSSAHLAPKYGGNARDYLQTLQRLRAMPVPDLVLPGHPTARGEPHSPRLSEAQWLEVLDRGISDVQIALDRTARDGVDFLDGVPKEVLPGLLYLGNYVQQAVYVLVAAEGIIVFDAPGDEGFAAFLKNGMKKLGVDSASIKGVVLTSCAPELLGGLHRLVQETGCEVVVPDDGRESVADRCPPGTKFVSPLDFFAAQSVKAEVIPLAGRGVAPAAYLISWKDKRVLVSGHIPTKISEQSVAQLREAIQSQSGDPAAFVESLIKLKSLNPDLWLPSQPVHCQNANLYEGDWQSVLGDNLRLLGK